MKKNTFSQTNPVGSAARAAKRQRTVGEGARCSTCGEHRAAALVCGSTPLVCAECRRVEQGKSPYDDHHVAGRNNHPVTISVRANDHRAILSDAQYNWFKETLENPTGDPTLRGAACVLGCVDSVVYVVKSTLLWMADFLVALSAFLVERFGLCWWRGTVLEQFAVPRKGV